MKGMFILYLIVIIYLFLYVNMIFFNIHRIYLLAYWYIFKTNLIDLKRNADARWMIAVFG